MRRALLTAALVTLAATGCSSGSAGQTSGSSAASSQRGNDIALASYRGHGIVFAYPLAWSHRRPGYMSPETQGFVDLSTQPMIDPCDTRGTTTSCGWPLLHLRPGGVVVTWTADYMPGLSIRRPRQGIHLTVAHPGYCRAFGATETVTVTARVVTPKHDVFLVNACLRAPGVASGERALRAMLASAHTT